MCTGCTTVSTSLSNSTHDFDWRHTDVDGQVASIPYHLDINKGELTIDMFEHKSVIGPGRHTFEIEPGKAEYKLKYILGRRYNYPIPDSSDRYESDPNATYSILENNQAELTQ